MRISMNMQSVTALREFAKSMPIALNELNELQEKMERTFSELETSLGPHADQFLSMLSDISRANKLSEEAIKELPYMINSTADKMEAYIIHGSGKGSMITNPSKEITQRFEDEAKARLDSADTNTDVKALYESYKQSVSIIDYDYLGTPFYSSLSGGIKLNAMADLHNPTGKMSTYYHEVGHLIDNVAGNGHAWLSSEPEFRKMVEYDVQTYVSATMISKHCNQEEAYDIISEEISGNLYANVSDIFGAVTICKCQGDWGHSVQYWEIDPSKLEKESFANMFESSVGSKEKADIMKHFFPHAYAVFETLIKGAL